MQGAQKSVNEEEGFEGPDKGEDSREEHETDVEVVELVRIQYLLSNEKLLNPPFVWF
jgi:hypothetical protein